MVPPSIGTNRQELSRWRGITRRMRRGRGGADGGLVGPGAAAARGPTLKRWSGRFGKRQARGLLRERDSGRVRRRVAIYEFLQRSDPAQKRSDASSHLVHAQLVACDGGVGAGELPSSCREFAAQILDLGAQLAALLHLQYQQDGRDEERGSQQPQPPAVRSRVSLDAGFLRLLFIHRAQMWVRGFSDALDFSGAVAQDWMTSFERLVFRRLVF